MPGVESLQRCPDIGSIYGEYVDRIYRLCRRLSGNETEAEDLTQEVFVEACRCIATFEGRSDPGTWLYTITVRLWHRRYERRERQKATEPMAVSPPRDLLAEEMNRIAFEQAMATLPVALREAWILVKAQGLKYRDAANVLGVPQGTVHTRVHEATMRLRAVLIEGAEPVGTGGRQACGTRDCREAQTG